MLSLKGVADRSVCLADHEADYPAETIVMQEADVGENEAAAMFEEVTGLGDGGVLNVNRRHVESVTLTPDAPVGPAERHNTVLRTLPPIAVASAHSTAPHARAANEVMLDAYGQRRGEVIGPISDDRVGTVAPAGGGRRVCHGAPATSAPVDHASRTGWGRTVRKPRSRLAGARQTRARVRRAAAVPAAGAARRSDL